MKRRLIWLLVLLMLLACGGCSMLNRLSSGSADQNLCLLVFSDIDDEDMKGATLFVENVHDDRETVDCHELYDGENRVYFADIAPGEYRVLFSADGYRTEEMYLLADDEPVNIILFYMKPYEATAEEDAPK